MYNVGDFVFLNRQVKQIVKVSENALLLEGIHYNRIWCQKSLVVPIPRLNTIVAESDKNWWKRKIKNKFETFALYKFQTTVYCHYSIEHVNISTSVKTVEEALRWLNFKYAKLKALE